MLIEQSRILAVPVQPLWDFITDPRAISACLPGLKWFEEVGDETFEGSVQVKLGPIGLLLGGRLFVESRNAVERSTLMRADGKDRRIPGSVIARIDVRLVERTPEETQMLVVTEATILGKLGEFGQPIIKRTADKVIEQFVQNIVRVLTGDQVGEEGASQRIA